MGPTSYRAQVIARVRELAADLPEPLRRPAGALAARPGKYLRAMLVAACARGGAADTGRLVHLGALVELLHLASLLHDDVIDRAPIRRGGPAAQVVVGDETAVLTGLGCFSLAGLQAADLGEPVARAVSSTVAVLAYGQMLDVERAFDTRLPLPDYLELAERKTGALFGLSCALGAAEAQATEADIRALGRFGAEFGVAFQVLDDCLDLAMRGPGKPAGIDHALGLFGAPTLHALREDSSGELAALLLSPAFDSTDMETVRRLVTERRGLTAARSLAQERYHGALTALAVVHDEGVREAVLEVTEVAWGHLA